MKNLPQVVGVDVSKLSLDVCIPGQKTFKTTNDEAGVEALLRVLPAELAVCLEASGGYERLLSQRLAAAGFEVRLVNPRKVSRIADALGHGAKTDALDAQLLSQAGALIRCPSLPSASRLSLASQSRHLERLATEIGRLKKQLQLPLLDGSVSASLGRLLAFMESERKLVRAELHRQLRGSVFWERYRLFFTVKSIGQETARTLALELPDDLWVYTPGQLCSYAGLAPMDSSSGLRVGQRHIRKGNSHLKRALYMAALNAICFREDLKAFYTGLRGRGKAHQSAIVAVMRKLLLEALATVKRGTRWQPAPPLRT